MLTYKTTENGYSIYQNGKLWLVQEGEYAYIYQGNTMEERAQNHINDLEDVPSDAEKLAEYVEALNTLGVEV